MKQKLLNAIFFLKFDYWEFPNFNIRHTGKGVNIKSLFLFFFLLIGSLIVNAQSARLYNATTTNICFGKNVTLKVQITGTQYSSYTIKYTYTNAATGMTTPNTINGFSTSNSIFVSGAGEYKLTSVVSNTNISIPLNLTPVIVTVNPAPAKPNVQTVIQPSCLVNKGSITLNTLPATGTWTINPGAIAGTGTSVVIPNLNPGSYSFTVNYNGCNSSPTNAVTINGQPAITPAPILNTNITLGCTQTSYLQEWSAVAIATGYKIDVATDEGFTNFLSGYQDKELTNLTSETITGLAPGTVYYVRLRAISDCGTSLNSNTINVNPMQSTTYDSGSWSNGLPDINKNVVFNSDFNISTNTNACSCQVNAGANVVVKSGIDLTIENALTVNPTGNLTFENNASLVQINNVPNSGNITYKRTTAPMKNFDYTFWSSPVSGQTLYNLSPNTLADKYFSYGPNGWVTLYNGTPVMEHGIGYIIRTPKDGTWPNGEVVSFPYSQQVKFIGVPNNGNINGETVPVDRYRLVGNPYPSALDADQFMSDNSSILNGTIYLWTHNTALSSVAVDGKYTYTSDDYAAYNGVGGILTRPALSTGINESEPTGKIAAGQSFMILSRAVGTITFNNSMRISGNNGQFFKQTKSKKTAIEKHRFWLNLTNKTGAFKQILIGYLPGATNEYDNRFDGDALNGNSFVSFYSKTQTKNLLIQGRALPIEDTDSIQLGYSSTIEGVFSIDISKLDGKFLNKAIYLEDKKTNTYFNLKNGGYEFSTLKGTFDDRFVIHYTPNVIQTPILSEVPDLTCNQTSFVINWDAIAYASSYRYDLATDEAFLNILPDFQDKEVSGYNSEEVTGLTGTKYYIRLRAMYNSVASANSNVIKVSLPTTVYNGEWSNGLPDSNKNIIFDNVNYTLPADISACSCQINATAKVTVPSGVTLKLQNSLSVKDKGSLTFENNASLVQINDAVNTGNIIYKRISAPMKTADYTYWSSPVADQKLNVLSPNTISNRYFSLYNNNWVSEQGSASMTPAKGYIIGAPKNGTWPNGEKVSFPYSQPVQFIGVPNNGHFEFITLNNSSKNLIGNPYPSALDADAFLEANSNVLGGTIYFWKNNTSPKFLKYLLDDYACYNALGGIAASAAGETSGGINSIKPTGKIAAGQSFMTESVISGTVVFDNNMRLEGENTQFLKPGRTGKTASVEKHRFWLNLTNALGSFEQILIGYADGATNNYDNRFDARDWSGNSYTSFYSVNQNDKLTIQGRTLPFDNADLVPLGYRSLLGGYFTIALDSADGLFAEQSIYLEDKKLNVFHNLKDGAYNFVSFLGTYDNRFVIHYNNGSNKTGKSSKTTVSDSTGLENQVLVSAENNQININSFEEIIDNVFVFDLNGKLIYEKEQVNTNEFSTPTLIFSNQMVVVKVTLQNGKTVIKKAIL
nr:T9SS sorting signal type C domain-containing protein [uncultured Flavobacterium sp.]